MSKVVQCQHCGGPVELAGTPPTQFTCPLCGNLNQFADGRDAEYPPVQAPASDEIAVCPHCAAETAAGAEFCTNCGRAASDGQLAPLARRMRYSRYRRRVLRRAASISALGLGAIAVVATGVIAVRWYAQPPQPIPLVPAPTTIEPPDPQAQATDATEALLRATDDAELAVARSGMQRLPEPRPRILLRRLQQDLRRPISGLQREYGLPPRRIRTNQLAAVEVLAEIAPTAAEELVPLLSETDDLHTAGHALALDLGHADAFPAVVRDWLELTERIVFLEYVARVHNDDAARAAARAARRTRLPSHTVLQRHFAENPTKLARIAAEYWSARTWIGQRDNHHFSQEAFDVARPPGNVDAVTSMRTARENLEAAAMEADAVDAAAIALVLRESAPQYRTLRDRIVARVRRLYPDAEPRDQQLLTWSLSVLSGRRLGDVRPDDEIEDVTPTDIHAGLRDFANTQQASLPPSPALLHRRQFTLRVVTPESRARARLLAQLDGDWDQAVPATAEWLAAGYGLTPELLARLDPGQRDPHPPSVAAAMLAASEQPTPEVQRMLLLWRDAQDQPHWLRALAAVTLMRTAAEAGDDPAPLWSAEIDPSALRALDQSPPGWGYFGHVIYRSPALTNWLADPPDSQPPLARWLRDRLLDARQRVARSGLVKTVY